MIHQARSISMTEKLREIPPAETDDFPYIALDADISLFSDGYSSWHWHEYFEFGTVTGGAMELSTQRRSLVLRAGEGYFVNSNVLHANRMIGPEPARLRVHQFGPALLGGGEIASRRYVKPIESCAALDALTLSPRDPAQRDILAALDDAFGAAEAEGFGFELRVAEALMRAWRGLGALAAPALREAAPASRDDGGRIKRMLSYIHAHYAEPISVADIAAAAGVGERECYRCFRQTLGLSPIPYLNRRRVEAAARLLNSTNRTVADIAADCGFGSPSYFCSVFREIMGRSPREFRRSSD